MEELINLVLSFGEIIGALLLAIAASWKTSQRKTKAILDDLAETKTERESLQESNQELKEKNETLDQTLKVVQTELREVRKEVNTLRSMSEEKDKQLEGYLTRIIKLESDVVALTDDKNKLAKDLKTERAANDELRLRLSEVTIESQTRMEMFNILSKNLNQLQFPPKDPVSKDDTIKSELSEKERITNESNTTDRSGSDSVVPDPGHGSGGGSGTDPGIIPVSG